MIGHRVYPLHVQFSSLEYDCSVTFLKVSDINISLRSSRSFPSAGLPARSEELPKRFLKLTTLYGTGQQEIGQFQISGSECDIKQRRNYKFFSTDPVSVTKLHIYIFNSGLTGHVTIDLKEFIGEDDAEIFLEYPLSASNSRHRTAKLQVVVQCKGPQDCGNDDCLDMDLETFLYDEFPESLLESPHKELEVEHLPHPAGAGGENNLDAFHHQPGSGPLSRGGLDGQKTKFRANTVLEIVGQQQGDEAQSQIPLLKDFEGEFLGLDSILKDFVTEYAQTRPFLVIGGQSKKRRDRKYPTQRDLQAAVFFAAGVTMQRRLQCSESNSQTTLLRTQESADHGTSSTNGESSVLLRSQSDEFDIKRILSCPERPLPEVVTVSKEAAISGLKLNEGPFLAPCSPSPDIREIESAKGSNIEATWQGRRYVRSPADVAACPTCSAESRVKDALPFHENLSPAVCDGSTALTSAEETQLLIPVSSSKPKRNYAVVVVRNILGILLIAGVSFVLGAHAGFFGATCGETNTDAASKRSDFQQAGTKTSVNLELEGASRP
ncbi:unnamed protein product [Calypogeia fissa]